MAAVAAPQRSGSHRAARARIPGVSGGFSGAARLACSAGLPLAVYVKKWRVSLRISRVVRTSVRVLCAYLTLPTLLCTRVCVV